MFYFCTNQLMGRCVFASVWLSHLKGQFFIYSYRAKFLHDAEEWLIRVNKNWVSLWRLVDPSSHPVEIVNHKVTTNPHSDFKQFFRVIELLVVLRSIKKYMKLVWGGLSAHSKSTTYNRTTPPSSGGSSVMSEQVWLTRILF